MNQGQSAVLAPKKEEFYPRVQSEPKLGGEGSGFPPRFYIATGQHNHTVLGIDIGSDSFRISILEEDTISNLVGTTPASLGLSSMGDWMVTDPMTYAGGTQSGCYRNTVQYVRTKLGTDWCRDFAGQLQGAEELMGKLMQYVVNLSQVSAKKSLRDAVLTVPASATSLERRLLKGLAEDFNLNIIQVINESTAAALSCCCFHDDLADGNYLIFQMGASTCAASVFCLSNGIMEIKATSAESNLGGRSFDEIIVIHLLEQFFAGYGTKPLLDELTLRRFEAKAKEIRHVLAMSNEVFFNIAEIKVAGPPRDKGNLSRPGQVTFSGSITRQHYDQLVQPVVDRAVSHIHQAVNQSHLQPDQISKMLVCGGATLSATLRSALAQESPSAACEYIEDDMLAARGAAVQAALVCQRTTGMVVWDVLNKPISIINAAGVEQALIAANTPLPVTAYAKLEIIDNTINARLVQGNPGDEKTYTDIVINNCPPCTNGENKVELAVRVSHDGIINYGARHIGLDVALLVCPLQEERRRYQGDLDSNVNVGEADVAGARAQRLARVLNLPLYNLPQALRALGYSSDEIVSGKAIELALRKIKMGRGNKGKKQQN